MKKKKDSLRFFSSLPKFVLRALEKGLAVRVSPAFADEVGFELAKREFDAGRYENARRLYASIRSEARLPDAELMTDWIDYKLGNFEIGWPRYKVTRMERPTKAPPVTDRSSIVVANGARPVELIERLGMKPWQPTQSVDGPVLIWFNFHDSLGGELLAARIVRAFQRQTNVSFVLAVDARLVRTVERNFPGTRVVNKASDLTDVGTCCRHYFMARDALAHVVRREADFANVSRDPFLVDAADPPEADARRRTFAMTWKTTNVDQGRYRNLPFDAFVAWLDTLDADFVSAQHGVTPEERAILTARLGDRIRFDVIDPRADPMDIAAQLRACSGVLTIDNSVLHIAGAFGVPAVGMLGIPSYWAWPAGGSNSRWYESVQLVHQTRPGRWDDVFNDVSEILKTTKQGVRP